MLIAKAFVQNETNLLEYPLPVSPGSEMSVQHGTRFKYTEISKVFQNIHLSIYRNYSATKKKKNLR